MEHELNVISKHFLGRTPVRDSKASRREAAGVKENLEFYNCTEEYWGEKKKKEN